ncbi:MAG: PKD domain-containing protein, partial [Microbacterium sp.]
VWPVGTEEPTDWTISAINAEARLQGSGQFGVTAYGTGSITNGPVNVSVDNLVVRGQGGDTPHVAPTARIASDANGLAVAFDGTGSEAADGATITGYEWNFGDGDTSTAAKPNHTYSANGTYAVTLTVTDSTGARSTAATASLTVAHVAPTARFDATATGFDVAVNGSASTAASGASLTYQWTWGDDSAAGSGATATHTYGAEGSYDITLKVTDSKGATDSVTKTVQASDASFIVRDEFGRNVTSGWGTADTGGAWTAGTGFSVADGVGKILVGKSQTRIASLDSVSAREIDERVTFSTDKVADGGGMHLNFVAQKTTEGEYRAKLRISSAGVIAVGLAKVVGTTETLIANRNLTGYTHAADTKVNVRFQTVADGASTILRVKVWPEGSEEPTAWWVTTTDAEAVLQAAGQVQVRAYATGTVANGPVTVSIDGLSIK